MILSFIMNSCRWNIGMNHLFALVASCLVALKVVRREDMFIILWKQCDTNLLPGLIFEESLNRATISFLLLHYAIFHCSLIRFLLSFSCSLLKKVHKNMNMYTKWQITEKYWSGTHGTRKNGLKRGWKDDCWSHHPLWQGRTALNTNGIKNYGRS